MLFYKKSEGTVEAVEYTPGMEDGIERQCSRSERCEYEDDGHCFDPPGPCEYQRPIPYIVTDATGAIEQGYPRAGDYIVTVDTYRREIVQKEEFITHYSLLFVCIRKTCL